MGKLVPFRLPLLPCYGFPSATSGDDHDPASKTLSWGEGGVRGVASSILEDSFSERSDTLQLTLPDPTGDAALDGATSILQILDACNLVGVESSWDSLATNIDFTVTGADTARGVVPRYSNPGATASVPIQETVTFETRSD